MVNVFNQVPLVSVGIPTYNRPAGLRRVLECITGQTYKNLEIIVSDNGSSENETEAVVRLFMSVDPRIKYYKQEINKGPTYNFNFVLEKASGDYFMWAADDDQFADNYIEECLNFLLNHPDYAMACGKALYYQDGKLIFQGVEMNLPQDSNCMRVLAYFSKIIDNATFYGVMRREQVLKVPYRNHMGNDWHFISGICFMGKVTTLSQTAIIRSIGGTSASYKNIADVSGLSDFEGNHPLLSIAVNAFRNILLRDKIYSTLCFFPRLCLASIVFFVILWRYIIKRKLFFITDYIIHKVKTYSFKIMPLFIINKYRYWKNRRQKHGSGYPPVQ